MDTRTNVSMLDADQIKIREQQKQTWDTFSPGWKKWDEWVMNFLNPLGVEIINQLKLKSTDKVLDVATGTGEPGLTIAQIVKDGKVIGTDLSPKMLSIADENAKKKNISNYETLEADVCNIPLPDSTFDAVSCRFGFMFFPDMLLAAKEMARVLKPGGKFATSVWGKPESNYWITSFMGPISKNVQLPPPLPGAPGMFRCADTSMMEKLFTDAGFRNVGHKVINSITEPDSVEFLWEYMTDVAAPVVSGLSMADAPTKDKIKREIFEGIKAKYPGNGKLKLDYQAVVFYGDK